MKNIEYVDVLYIRPRRQITENSHLSLYHFFKFSFFSRTVSTRFFLPVHRSSASCVNFYSPPHRDSVLLDFGLRDTTSRDPNGYVSPTHLPLSSFSLSLSLSLSLRRFLFHSQSVRWLIKLCATSIKLSIDLFISRSEMDAWIIAINCSITRIGLYRREREMEERDSN